MKVECSNLLTVALVGLLTHCAGPTPDGLGRSPASQGPSIIFDLDAKPFPEIPLPNDLATRLDPTSPTGRRLNISLRATTRLESDLRTKADNLNGFGIFEPISVRFDAPLDLQDLVARHHDRDFSNDAVYLLNITRSSRHFGEATLLDMGRGHFPLLLPRPDAYFENDPRVQVQNLIYEVTDEDLNGNGVLDPGEDSDADGVLDRPNTYDGSLDEATQLITFYEKETDTLTLRPVVPLREGETYAVVITKRLKGENGAPVRSPFETINHTRQTDALHHLPEAVAHYGLKLDEVAFTWSFTTQRVTEVIDAIRAGTYGHGPLAWLKEQYPAEISEVHELKEEGDNLHVVYNEEIADLAGLMAPVLVQMRGQAAVVFRENFAHVDYLVSGVFDTPYFLADRDGIATEQHPSDEDECFEIDLEAGTALQKPQPVSWLCVVPKKDRGNGPPFPVTIYQHGTASNRFAAVFFAPNFARLGIATCALDAVGHGLVIPPGVYKIFDVDKLAEEFKLQKFLAVTVGGRARDLNGDPVPDPGADFWTADLFHTRDVVRQTVVDLMRFVQIMRNFDGQQRWSFDLDGDGERELAGDFNGDGVVDLGGPTTAYSAYGVSLGGIVVSVLAGAEPMLSAVAPIAGGGGLLDIGARSINPGLPEAVYMPLMGTMIIGNPTDEGKLELSFVLSNLIMWGTEGIFEFEFRSLHPFAAIADVQPGDVVVVRNLVNGEEDRVMVPDSHQLRLQIAADALSIGERRPLLAGPPSPEDPPVVTDATVLGDGLEVEVLDGPDGPVKASVRTFQIDVDYQGVRYPAGSPLAALSEGFGMRRNTPRLRRFYELAELILEPGDPIGYARRHFEEPPDTSWYDPTAEPGTNMLYVVTLGDRVVPVATAVAMARAAGLWDHLQADPRYGKSVDEVLIDNYVMEGLSRLKRFGRDSIGLMDPDDLDQGTDGFSPPTLDPPLRVTRNTSLGVSALRFAFVTPEGAHGIRGAYADRPFDITQFVLNQLAYYFYHEGRKLSDDPCLADASCEFLP